jgi:hypothetical protein
MPVWKLMVREPSLDELLRDEMMAAVTRSAGLDLGGLRALLVDVAARVPPERATRRSACSAAPDCRPSAA